MTLGSRLPDPPMLGLTQLSNEREQLHRLRSIPPWGTLRLLCAMTATEFWQHQRGCRAGRWVRRSTIATCD